MFNPASVEEVYLPWYNETKNFIVDVAALNFDKLVELHPFGSGTYGLALVNSDADVCIQFKDPLSAADACAKVLFLATLIFTYRPQWLRSMIWPLDHGG